jgi:NAD dependent epimerase/dehydratase
VNLASSKIFVSGAGGFIGSHLVEALVRKGCHVRALVRYGSTGTAGWLDGLSAEASKSVEIRHGDLRDAIGVRSTMTGCDVIFHLGALIGIPYSYVAPDAYVDVNVKGTLNVLQAGRELSVRKIVATSTSEVYGTARFVPITEEHPLQGQSPYSATKIAADHLALSFYNAFELPVTIARPFNTYGPRQSARAIIPTIITQIAAGQRSLRLGSLHPTRDFNYVADTVSGMIAIAESDRSIGEVINLGSNFEVSMQDTAKTIARLMGADVRFEVDNERVRPGASEVERLWADNTKARELVGWQPGFGGLEGFERGLTATIEWFQHPENLQRYNAARYNV